MIQILYTPVGSEYESHGADMAGSIDHLGKLQHQ